MWKRIYDCVKPDRVEESGQKLCSSDTIGEKKQETFELIDHQLKVLLAEYETLRKEIQSRSDIQHRLLQIHVGALTLILAAAVGDAVSRWIILVVPFLSAIFGLRWLDHSTSVRDIGQYIADHHEAYIDRLLGTKELINWERRQRSGESSMKQHRWSQSPWASHTWTFMWPSVAVLGLAAAGAALSSPMARDVELLSEAVEGFDHFFPMAAEYQSIKWLVFSVVFIFGSIVVGQYELRYIKYRKFVRRQLE